MYLVYLICISLFLIRVQTETTKVKNDYCTQVDCSLEGQHTMCAAADKQSDRLYASGMTTWMRHQILLLHNIHRDNIAMGLEAGQPPATNMRKMYWDFELEKMAETWARQCQKRHDECRNTVSFNVLQNIDVRHVVPKATQALILKDAVGAWFSGSRVMPPENVFSFKLSNCSSPSGCNDHWYSIAAWASTWRIGCSQAFCSANQPTCALYRKKRGTDHKLKTKDVKGDDPIRNTTLRAVIRGSTPSPNFNDYVISQKTRNNESLLHRGNMGVDKKLEKNIGNLEVFAFTVCNYGPAGNIEGFPIYEAGSPCKNCPQHTRCGDHTHRGLCSVNGDPDL